MWIDSIQVALGELFEVYSLYCCVKRIYNNVITMTNGDKWIMNSNGHIKRIEKE